MSSTIQRAAPAINRAGSGLPSRVVIHGVEGIGKTSIGAFAPKPVFAMTRGETGLLTLIDNGLVPPTDHFDEAQSWNELLEQMRWLVSSQHENRTFVLDTLNGAERLCFEHVMRDKFRGDPEAFMAYGKGPEIAQAEWIKLLLLLDELRATRRMAMMLLCHTRIKTFRNPEGDDFDRYVPDMHEKVWGLTHKWADVVLFANFETFAKKDRGAMKAKGIGGEARVLYTQRTAAYDAKNRLGLPAEIPMSNTTEGGWQAFSQAMRAARAARQQQPAVDDNQQVTQQEN